MVADILARPDVQEKIALLSVEPAYLDDAAYGAMLAAESASTPGKRPFEERERDRASHSDQSHQDNARGDRNPGNFQNREAGRKGGER